MILGKRVLVGRCRAACLRFSRDSLFVKLGLMNSTLEIPPKYLILGTAGHIDHGKTTLVRALTGKNTDRLPEEQKRGITIELGFAHLSSPPYEFGIVDVPGHHRFVKTMLAGSTGVDLVMLIVAADDSINQQTREHLDILKFLDIPAGVIVLSKCDRVESEWLEMVEEEVRGLVADSFLAEAPLVRTSAATGAGLEELKRALMAAGEVAVTARSSRLEQPFRMPIDRVFSIPGHGTVVTGSVTHGRLAVGESIQILPEWPDREIRVRQLQSHDRAVEHVERGQRAAVNLAGVSVAEVRRGFQLVAPGQLPASDCLTVSLTASEQMATGVRDHQPIRLHLATSVVLGKVRFLQARGGQDAVASVEEVSAGEMGESSVGTADATSAEVPGSGFDADGGGPLTEVSEQTVEREVPIKVLAPGKTVLAQLLLDRPVLANWGQRMVVRRPSPIETLGQAVVLDPCLGRLARPDRTDLEFVQQLQSADPIERLTAAMYFSFDGRPPGATLRNRLAIPEEQWDAVVQVASEQCVAISDHASQWLFHPRRLEKLKQMILKFLDQQHTLQPKRWFIDRALVERHLHFLPPAVVVALLRQLQQTHKLRHSATGIGLPNRGPNLTKNKLKLLEQLLQQFRGAGLNPPTIEQCIAQTPKNKQDVVDLLKMATESGDLVAIDKQTFLASECFEAAWQLLLPHFADGNGLTVSQIRDHLEITRKLAVPLCEYLDAVGLTVRNGDVRQLAGEVAAPP